jgi:hypothetical protein
LGPRHQRYHQVRRLRFRSFSYRSLSLEIGAKLASCSSAGETALHLACYSGSLDTVNALLESRAATNIVGINGTPLDIAKRYTQLPNSNLNFPSRCPRSHYLPSFTYHHSAKTTSGWSWLCSSTNRRRNLPTIA